MLTSETPTKAAPEVLAFFLLLEEMTHEFGIAGRFIVWDTETTWIKFEALGREWTVSTAMEGITFLSGLREGIRFTAKVPA